MPSIVSLVIGREPLQADSAGIRVPLRLPWYRSLPLSSIESLELSIDGRPVARDRIRIEANGELLTLDDMAQRSDEFWFVQDTAYAWVPSEAPVGPTVAVAAEATVRIPYIMIGADQPLRRQITDAATLPVSEKK